jgi:hypothetical protein
MIKTHQILRKNNSILIGIALDNAVLDVVTSETQLRECLKLLQERHRGSARPQMGTFGSYAVALNVDNDDTVSLFVDGPNFEPTRSQSAAIWLGKEDLRRLLVEALEGASTVL